jgi:hypothetical protein
LTRGSGDSAQKHSNGISTSNGYSTWEQVSGYFDGDGGIRITVGKFTIQILVVWSDTDFEQIQHVAQFLRSKGMRPEGPYLRQGKGKSNDDYNLLVSLEGGALAVLNGMLPFVDKKWSQAKAAVDYLEDGVTGDEFVDRINLAVELRKRRAPRAPFLPKGSGIPYRRSEGLRKTAAYAASKQRFKLRFRFDGNQIEQIRKDVLINKKSVKDVAKLYGISSTSVMRLVNGKR